MKHGQLQQTQKVWWHIRRHRCTHIVRHGFSVVEVLLAATVFSMLVTAFVGAYLYGEEATMLAGNRARAALLAEEALAAVRNMRDADFANLTDGTHGLGMTSNEWVFSGTSDATDIFTREVIVGTVDANRKNVITHVSWQQNAQRTGVVTLTTLLANWQASGGVGDWSTPSTENTLDLPGNSDGLKIQTSGDYAYIVLSSGTSNFVIVDVSNPAALSVVSTLSVAGTPTNIQIDGNYAYVTSTDNAQELSIIDITIPSTPSVVGTYNDGGTQNAMDVAIVGTTAFVTFSGGDDIVAVDIATPSAPSFLDGINLNGKGGEIVVLGTEAYVASTGAELQVVDITTPSALSLIDSFNLPGNSNGNAIAGFGNTILLGRTNGDVHNIDVSTPSAPSLADTYNTGTVVNDISLHNSNTYAYIAEDENAAEFQILDISTPTAMILLGSLNLVADLHGVAYSVAKDRVFGASFSNAEEVMVFMPS